MNRWWTLALLGAIAAALLLRWPHPEQRPMHNDEGVNGIKFGQLWERGFYRYDPHEYHGPTLAYATALFSVVSGAPSKISDFSEARLRWVTIVFGIGLIPLVLLLRRGLGTAPVFWAAFFIAVSPSFAFYSSYYIHEMPLVFFTAAFFGCAWRYWRSRKLAWAIAAGLSFGLTAATKETFVISLGAAGLALLLNHLWNKFFDATGDPAKTRPLSMLHIALGLVVAMVTAVLLFSSFFSNPAGVLDAVRTYFPWLSRAGGASPHIHPWDFYAQRLLWFSRSGGPVWTEMLILLLAMAGAASGFLRRNMGDTHGSLVRFLFFYGFILAGIYSAIPYKTPWCLLSFWHAMILLAAVGAAWLIRVAGSRPAKVTLVMILLLGIAHLAWQAWRSQNQFGADRRNPYVYAQTSRDLLGMVERIHALTTAGTGETTLIKVISNQGGYWPLPWYLRRYQNVGWWDKLPEDPYGPIMIVFAKMNALLDENGTHLMVAYYELRPGVFLELYVELELWKKYLALNPAPRED